jgi:hypothetical protein
MLFVRRLRILRLSVLLVQLPRLLMGGVALETSRNLPLPWRFTMRAQLTLELGKFFFDRGNAFFKLSRRHGRSLQKRRS